MPEDTEAKGDVAETIEEIKCGDAVCVTHRRINGVTREKLTKQRTRS